MSPEVSLKDVPSNPTYAEVDDVVLKRGGEAKDLSDDQLERLTKSTKVKVDVDGQESEDDDSQEDEQGENPDNDEPAAETHGFGGGEQ